MHEFQLTEMETKFADILWENVPLGSPALVRLCGAALNWKKSTTYTMLRKLAHKGLFRNENGTVTALVSKQDFYDAQSKHYVDETFNGSLPQFFAAFTRQSTLSDAEINELQHMIAAHREG